MKWRPDAQTHDAMVENTDLLAFKTTFICRTTTQPATLTLCTGPSHRWWRIMSPADESREVLWWGWFLTLPEASIQTAPLIWPTVNLYPSLFWINILMKISYKQCLSNTLYCLRQQVPGWYTGVTLKRPLPFSTDFFLIEFWQWVLVFQWLRLD